MVAARRPLSGQHAAAVIRTVEQVEQRDRALRTGPVVSEANLNRAIERALELDVQVSPGGRERAAAGGEVEVGGKSGTEFRQVPGAAVVEVVR